MRHLFAGVDTELTAAHRLVRGYSSAAELNALRTGASTSSDPEVALIAIVE
jgi:hypothetical protein